MNKLSVKFPIDKPLMQCYNNIKYNNLRGRVIIPYRQLKSAS